MAAAVAAASPVPVPDVTAALASAPALASQDPADELDTVAIRDILDADSRPTFVLDLDPDESPERIKALVPVFCNAALRQHERLFDALIGVEAHGVDADEEGHEPKPTTTPPPSMPNPSPDRLPLRHKYDDFRRWATGVTPHDDSKDVYPLSMLYADLLWTGSTVRQRWRIVSGNSLWRHADTDIAASKLARLSSESLVNNTTLPVPPPNDAKEDTNKPAQAASKDAPKQERKRAKTHERPPATALVKPAVESLSMPMSRATTDIASTSATAVSSRQQINNISYYPPQTPEGSSNDTGSSSYGPTIPISMTVPEKVIADWTVPEPQLKGTVSQHIRLARSIDWANTPLGAMESWSPEFRQVANLMMNNPFPCALFWGSELTMLYNEPYAKEVSGNKHPSLMGTGFSGPFSELWDYAGPVFEECARTGISVRKEYDYLPIDRHGLLEETFYSWSFVPLYGGTKRILGFYNAPFETTSSVLSQRYLMTINHLGDHTAHAKTVTQFWSLVLESLEENHYDVPFAMLYSVGDAEEEDVSTSSGSTLSLKSCHLEGAIAVPADHPAAPVQIDLKRSREGFVPSFREAMRTREPILLHTRDGTLPEALLEGIKWRGFGDPCREAIIFPVRPTNGDVVMAFLVLGVNPRRPYDDFYKAFISMLNRQLATSLASAILYEDEVRRSRNAAETAALEKEQLTEELALQASRLRRMTELSPLGMFLIEPDGVLREANDRFFEMTGNTRGHSDAQLAWLDFVLESSRATMDEGWCRLVTEKVPWSGELQLKKRGLGPVNLHGEAIDYWVIFTAHSEFARDGSLRSIMGSITDISHLKWAQGLQQRQLQEAEETRRQQNEFIDITSHEMRNPLSAILQCADDITSALAEARATGSPPAPSIIESCIDAAQTIALCVQHQKSIVDDILAISKLDSNLLLITPVSIQPEAILRRAVKMFESELQAKQIEVKVEVHPSYNHLTVDWVVADPSRLLQVLINLVTNGIKFTTPAEKRILTVGIAASLQPPDAAFTCPDFQYVESKQGTGAGNFAGFGEEWGMGEILYVRFHVQDTGCGLSLSEKQMLFQRFKQASPRTHAQYGGSGLGLFISKRLAELHGGQIGVASTAGHGSIFGFFIQCRRSSPPTDTTAAIQEAHDLRIEHHLGADTSSLNTLTVTPQRLDYAGSLGGPGEIVVARSKSGPAVKEPPKAPQETGTSSTSGKPQAQQPAFDPKYLHILVVEDNLINQKVLVKALRQRGSTVHTANDGVEALAFLERTRFRRGAEQLPLDIILMDLEMPNMDGLTCVSRIRRMETEGEIDGRVPVIAVTANVRVEQVAEARRSGMDDLLSKPFRIAELLVMMGKALTM